LIWKILELELRTCIEHHGTELEHLLSGRMPAHIEYKHYMLRLECVVDLMATRAEELATRAEEREKVALELSVETLQ